MKKALLALGLLWSAVANAQFTPGQLLTAGELNAQFALYAPLAGATFTGSVAANAGLTASAITGTPISGSTGSFTTLSASSTVTLPSGSLPLTNLATQAANTIVANGTGSTASPTAIAAPSCSTSSSALQWTSGTGLACNSAINASTLGGATFASPGAIGSGTASSGAFTTLSASSTVSGSGFSTYLASPPAIGGTSANTGAFTNLSSSGTVSGTGFSAYLASPPAIGGTAASAGTFTTLSSTGNFTPSQTNGIVGTTTNNNANAGSVGEYVTVSGSGVSVTNSTAANITSISLTAGDWDVTGNIIWGAAGGAAPTNLLSSVNNTSATSAASPFLATMALTYPSNSSYNLIAPIQRFSLASTTTIYLVANQAFSTGTMTASGYIRARRIR